MAAGATIRSVDSLRAMYRPPARRSLDKEIDHLDGHCRQFIARSPFLVLGTTDGEGRVDVSPKGGPPGFVRALDDRRLAVPDMAGNNRLDSLTNVLRSDAVSMLFLIPGLDETLRVVGAGSISVDEDVLSACPVAGMRPNVALVVDVATAFLHCAKALRRSAIWNPGEWPSLDGLASPACMLRDHIGLPGTVEESQAMLDDSYTRTTWAMGATTPP